MEADRLDRECFMAVMQGMEGCTYKELHVREQTKYDMG